MSVRVGDLVRLKNPRFFSMATRYLYNFEKNNLFYVYNTDHGGSYIKVMWLGREKIKFSFRTNYLQKIS